MGRSPFYTPFTISGKLGVLSIIIVSILAGVVLWDNAFAAVTLVYFILEGGDQQVKVKWKTATELDNAGFFVQRSNQSDAGFSRINPTIIPAKGDSLTGGDYEYLDNNVSNGVRYWYRLESIDFGQQSMVYTPTSVLVGIAPASTLTSTPTITRTATRTSAPTASQGVTATTPINRPGSPTVSPSITATSGLPYPGPGTATQVFPPVPSPTGVTPGAPAEILAPTGPPPEITYKPFPTVTILFPDVTETTLFKFRSNQSGAINWISGNIGRLWPLLLVIGLWFFLLIWFYRAYRKLE